MGKVTFSLLLTTPPFNPFLLIALLLAPSGYDPRAPGLDLLAAVYLKLDVLYSEFFYMHFFALKASSLNCLLAELFDAPSEL